MPGAAREAAPRPRRRRRLGRRAAPRPLAGDGPAEPFRSCRIPVGLPAPAGPRRGAGPGQALDGRARRAAAPCRRRPLVRRWPSARAFPSRRVGQELRPRRPGTLGRRRFPQPRRGQRHPQVRCPARASARQRLAPCRDRALRALAGRGSLGRAPRGRSPGLRLVRPAPQRADAAPGGCGPWPSRSGPSSWIRRSRSGRASRRRGGRWSADGGCLNLEVPLSAVCATDAFRRFTALVVGDAARFAAVHNEAVRVYRARHGIRGASHPVPDLATEGDWHEAPFWAWKAGDTRRARVFAHRGQTRPEGKLRSRALATTLFARLLLADLFVHGIGGGEIRRADRRDHPPLLRHRAARLRRAERHGAASPGGLRGRAGGCAPPRRQAA